MPVIGVKKSSINNKLLTPNEAIRSTSKSRLSINLGQPKLGALGIGSLDIRSKSNLSLNRAACNNVSCRTNEKSIEVSSRKNSSIREETTTPETANQIYGDMMMNFLSIDGNHLHPSSLCVSRENLNQVLPPILSRCATPKRDRSESKQILAKIHETNKAGPPPPSTRINKDSNKEQEVITLATFIRRPLNSFMLITGAEPVDVENDGNGDQDCINCNGNNNEAFHWGSGAFDDKSGENVGKHLQGGNMVDNVTQGNNNNNQSSNEKSPSKNRLDSEKTVQQYSRLRNLRKNSIKDQEKRIIKDIDHKQASIKADKILGYNTLERFILDEKSEELSKIRKTPTFYIPKTPARLTYHSGPLKALHCKHYFKIFILGLFFPFVLVNRNLESICNGSCHNRKMYQERRRKNLLLAFLYLTCEIISIFSYFLMRRTRQILEILHENYENIAQDHHRSHDQHDQIIKGPPLGFDKFSDLQLLIFFVSVITFIVSVVILISLQLLIRIMVRRHHNMESETGIFDFVIACLCPVCNLTQNFIENEKRRTCSDCRKGQCGN